MSKLEIYDELIRIQGYLAPTMQVEEIDTFMTELQDLIAKIEEDASFGSWQI